MLLNPYRFSFSGDPYADYVVSLLHFDEDTAGVTPVDATGRTWTLAGGVPSSSPALFGKSRLFGPYGAGATQITTAAHADLDMGTADFTLEFSLYSSAASQGNYGSPIGSNRFGWGTGAVLFSFQPGTNNRLDFYEYDHYTANSTYAVTFGTYTADQWTRYALVRSGTNLLAFVDGNLVFTRTGFTQAINFGYNGLALGFNLINSGNYQGLMDEFRLTKGIARYTGNYTVDDSPFSYP
jgi:hypothetical protein